MKTKQMQTSRLLSIASAPIHSEGISGKFCASFVSRGVLFDELARLLSLKNGFYAFEGALHVLPLLETPTNTGSIGAEAWNERGLWRCWYQDLLDGMYFFAEDIFGGQFAFRENEIVSFDPESGEIVFLARSVEGWAKELLSNYRQLTGAPIAHAWQQVNGQIPVGKRLLPKIPFILGGQYEEKNLIAVDSVKGMCYRGELFEQIRDLPDGAQVRLKALPTH